MLKDLECLSGLSVNGLSKEFGQKSVLRDVTFSAPAGEFIALLGASGAGKTTLIRCICGIENPDSGSIALSAQSSRASSSLNAERISVIFQDLNLVRRLSAVENVIAAMANELSWSEKLWRVYRHNTLERAIGSLQQVGIAQLAWTRADKLSGGEQQRVAIARALARHSELIIADEPVASLDEATARDVLGTLKQVGRAAGAVVICSLHQVDLALQFADRLIGLRDGRVLFDEAADQIQRATVEKAYATAA